MTIKNITDTVIKGFGTGVGGFSNAATCLYAMAAIFKPEDPRQEELVRRIDLEREIVGQEIDRIKGADKPYLPTKWKKYETIPDPASGASQDEIRAAYRRNSMVISKKPYFFRYLYPELDALYRKFESSYDKASLAMFGIHFKKLLSTSRAQRTKDQDDLVRRYEKYNPLITAPCAMNLLCRAVEAEDFDLRFGRFDKGGPSTMLPTYPDLDISPEKLVAAESAYKAYKAKTTHAALSAAIAAIGADPDAPEFSDARAEAMDALLEGVRKTLSDADVTPPELLRACGLMAASRKSFDWGFAWDVLDAAILPLIPQGRTIAPCPDPDGPLTYLGVAHRAVDATRWSEISIDRVIRAIFGDYDGWGADYSQDMQPPKETETEIEKEETDGK